MGVYKIGARKNSDRFRNLGSKPKNFWGCQIKAGFGTLPLLELQFAFSATATRLCSVFGYQALAFRVTIKERFHLDLNNSASPIRLKVKRVLCSTSSRSTRV